MAFVNYNNKEITVKIVYYGPAISGKTTCLRHLYSNREFGTSKGKLITLDTDGDRTLFFDFLPVEFGKIGDYKLKIQLYTVPGQVAYDTTRKLVLQGADGVVFVADSQIEMQKQNIDSLENLKVNLNSNGLNYNEIPVVFHYNKRDLRDIQPIKILNRDLNPDNYPFFPTIATNGDNILEGLNSIMKMVIIYLKSKLSVFQNQKDKTVMFSKQEIRNAEQNNNLNTMQFNSDDNKMSMPDKSDQVSAQNNVDEIFELSDSFEEDNSSEVPDEDPDIFSLNADNMIMESPGQIEVPDVDITAEISGPDDDAPTGSNITQKELSVKQEKGAESVDIPVVLKIPENQDKISLNLNLKITIEKY